MLVFRLGCDSFTDPLAKPTPNAGATRSLFFPDEAIFPGHPRFKTLSRNIRQRRGEKVAINLPGKYRILHGILKFWSRGQVLLIRIANPKYTVDYNLTRFLN